MYNSHHSDEGTVYLVQRQREVLLCRYVPQHDGQFPFILHCGIYTVLHLHKQHSQTTQNTCIGHAFYITQKKKKKETTMCRCWFRPIPLAAERTTPQSGSRARRCRTTAPLLRGSCCVRSGRGATRRPAGFASPAASGWSHTTEQETRKKQSSTIWIQLHVELIAWRLKVTDPQILSENRANGVGLDARLPLALSRRVRQQVGLHVTAMKATQEISQAPLEKILCRLFLCLYFITADSHK